MNERIAKLAEQATIHSPEGFYTYTQIDAEKFAELIVKECIDQLNVSDVPPQITAGLNLGKAAIKQHFRVKE